MNKEKKQLLLAAIFMIIYLIGSIIYLYSINALISKNIIDNVLNYTTFIISIIGIIYFLILTKNDVDLNKHYKGILAVSIFFFICNIVSGVFGFMIYSNLDTGKEKKVKRELPKIEYQEFTNKYICLIAFAVSLFLIMYPKVENITQMILLYLLIIAIMVIVFRKQLVHDFKIFKEYFREYMSLTVKTWLKSLVVMMILSLSIQVITGTENSNNQQNLQTMFNLSPIIIGLVSVVYAPLVEELMFRGVFRKFLKNKYVFIILSGVIFGLMHVIDDSKTIAEFSYVLIYLSLGMYLASLYYETNNIFTNISFHFMQNMLGVIGMLLLKFMV